jgi:hypothetical protein
MPLNSAVQMQKCIFELFGCWTKYNEWTFAERSSKVVLKHLRMYECQVVVENLIFKMCPLFPKFHEFLTEIPENIKMSP